MNQTFQTIYETPIGKIFPKDWIIIRTAWGDVVVQVGSNQSIDRNSIPVSEDGIIGYWSEFDKIIKKITKEKNPEYFI